jgi:hypothetical protein
MGLLGPIMCTGCRPRCWPNPRLALDEIGFFSHSHLASHVFLLLATAALSVHRWAPPAAYLGATVRSHGPCHHTLGSSFAFSFPLFLELSRCGLRPEHR